MTKFFEFFKRLFSKKENKINVVVEPVKEDKDRDKFEKAMKFIRVVEGGKFFHPNDPGGFTNMGLTQRDYPNLDLKNLTREQADNIFYKDYWKKSFAHILPFPAYISYFDAVVNAGVGRANKILQEALKVKSDGVIGPKTINALNNFSDPTKLALALADGKQNFYLRLTKSRPKLKSFIKGWTRRTKALKDYITLGEFSW